MRNNGWIVETVLGVSMVVGCAGKAGAQSAPTTKAVEVQGAKPQAAPASVDATLDKLDVLGKDLKDFSAHVELSEIDSTSGNATTRIGMVRYQLVAEGNARIRVTFDKKEEDERLYDEKIEYLLQNGSLIDRNYNTKSETRRQVLQPGEKANLLKLGEGPFPLPIGQEKAEVHKLFDVTLIPAGADDPANTTHIKLAPKPDTQFAGKFHGIDVWVDNASNFPVRIDTEDGNQTNTRKTIFKGVKTNTGLNDEDFMLEAVEGWNVQTGEFVE